MSGPFRYLGYAGLGLMLGSGLSSACSASDPSGSAGGGNVSFGGAAGAAASSGSGGTSGSDASTGGGINLDGSLNDGNVDPDAACDLQTYQATLTKQPVDVIFVVDNSCSMNEEMAAVEANINQNFAQIIAASGIDYRVILIGEHGPTSQGSLCIGPPLGGSPCSGVTADSPPSNNPPVFFHYDHNDVESWDSWCKMLDWYATPDRYNLAPSGWGAWLRKEALKTFVEITDDRIDCKYPGTSTVYSSCTTNGPMCFDDGSSGTALAQTAAQQFDQELLALDPTQFGTAQSRNYIWHSIVGVVKNPSSTTGAYEPTEPIVPYGTKCSTAVNSGMGYQALSIMTGGLRFPVCEGTGFDVVFQKIADGVIKGAKLECNFPMPDPPPGKELDPNTIQIQFTPSGGGSPETFKQVANASACTSGSFYLSGVGAGDGGAGEIVLCPDTCTKVQADSSANVQILALCKAGGPI